MADPKDDINQIITSAVQARVEAAVVEALASDGTIRAYVAAALNRQVDTSGYGREKKSLLSHLLQNTVEEMTKRVVAEEIKSHEDVIRAEVRAALEKSIGVISDSLVDGFVSNAAGRYPSVRVEFASRD